MVAGFTPAKEVNRILMKPVERVEKVARDLFREGWVEGPTITVSMVSLVEEVELLGGEKEEEEEEGTLKEAVELIFMIPVGVGEAPTTMKTTRTRNVVITTLVRVVKSLLRSLSRRSLFGMVEYSYKYLISQG